MSSFSLPVLEMQLVLIFAITQASYRIFRPMGVPPFASQLITGMILSPSFLGRFTIFKDLFTIRSQEIIGILAGFGHVLFLILSAVKMDIGNIKRLGKKALFTGIASLMAPMLIGSYLLQAKLAKSWLNGEELLNLSFLLAIHSLTSFPVVIYLLEHLKMLNSELGQFGLSASLVSDFSSLTLMILGTLAKLAKVKGSMYAIKEAGSIILFLLVVVFAFRPAMFWIVRQTPEGKPVKNIYIYIIMVVMLFSGLFTLSHGMSIFLGPYLVGLAIPYGLPLGPVMIKKLNSFTHNVFHPLFVTTCAMRTDLRLLNFNGRPMIYNAILVSATFLAKMLGSFVLSLYYSKMPFNDALVIALIMSFKGAVHLGFYTFFGFYPTVTLRDQSLSFECVVLLLNVIILPILVKFLYDPSRKYACYQKRNILGCRSNQELRVLVCIRRSTNLSAVIRLLGAASSSPARPRLAIYVLHLIKLAEEASRPVFISHQKQKKIPFRNSYSEIVIKAFSHFKRDIQGTAVSVKFFTVVRPSKVMAEGICSLALDKLASFIILPFHRKWSVDGCVASEDSTIQTLNRNVLEHAPCSVGILVDRGDDYNLGRSSTLMLSSDSSTYSVAMIFLGGNDDREALSFAKRMSNKYSKISLTVIHLVSPGSNELDVTNYLENVLDSLALKDVILNNGDDEYVRYLEEIVQDGPQMTSTVCSMVDEYDLIIVGRRHKMESPQTSGLAELSKFPELGIIGDLLASSDLNTRTSVLVVQQQKKSI
ncbi:cation/H(+) antiporter 4-like [Juglans microcarpa x Juglans regia]|uniref:cation/H(+) antiporter 4-like n=1 Tax=Juglans microcarpa x Juglans regia TaxID=2249226 RepID=UPI001B7F2D34|nr:cation/H(+) antiporter 4-like [Juglans microcarpa x Juglans regia]